MTGFRRTRTPPLVISSALFAIYRLSLRDHVAFILQGFRDLGRYEHIRSRRVVKSCSLVEVHRILGVSYRLHLQGQRQERNQLFITGSSCCLFIIAFLLGSLIHHEDGGGKLLRNVGGLYSTIQHYNPVDCALQSYNSECLKSHIPVLSRVSLLFSPM